MTSFPTPTCRKRLVQEEEQQQADKRTRQSSTDQEIIEFIERTRPLFFPENRLGHFIVQDREIIVVDGAARTPLHYAAIRGLTKTVMFLIKGHSIFSQDLINIQFFSSAAKINCKDKNGFTPLHYAIQKGHKDVTRVLVDGGVSLEFRDGRGRTYLSFAVIEKAEKMARLLVELGADPNAKDMSGRTSLHYAYLRGYGYLVDFLLSKGANPNVEDALKAKPLDYRGLTDGSEEDLVISAGANARYIDPQDRTPAFLAVARDGTRELVKCYLDAGAQVYGVETESPLHAACGFNTIDVVKLLIDRGADLEAKNADGQNPLYEALFYDNKEIARLLLKRGASTGVIGPEGKTPLHWSCYQMEANEKMIELMDLLIAHGADINARADDGSTPLHDAVKLAYLPIIEHHIKMKANPQVLDAERNTLLHALGKTNRYNCIEAARYLTNTFALDVKQANSKGETPLHFAAENNNQKLLLFFLSIGANPNAQDMGGNTPLHAICEKIILMHQQGLTDFWVYDHVIVPLLEAAADPTILNNSGESPIEILGQFGDGEVERLRLGLN